jgi:hypothetical protein
MYQIIKKRSLLFLLVVISLVSSGQNEKYLLLMKETVLLMDTATTISSLRETVNRFERIGKKKRIRSGTYMSIRLNIILIWLAE